MDSIYNIRNLEIILRYTSDGIQLISHEGNLVFCNRKAALQDDINIEDSLGKKLLDVYPSLSEETSTLLRVIKSGVPMLDIEQTYTTYKGKKITTINSTIPVRNGGQVIGAIEISRNITSVKYLSEKVAHLQTKGLKNKENIVSDTAKYTFQDIITKNPKMMRLKSKSARAAVAPSHILVYGETGTGKELLVQSIHNASNRSNKPFIAQNCAALPTTLLEGILFGTKKGGFTGAMDRPGLFELADGGTLFLDEINSMPLELQAKLLRVIQDGQIRRVGDVNTRGINIRVIAATNVEPIEAVKNGYIRTDLYYRLNTISLEIPSLKERTDDILLLTNYFIEKYRRINIKNVKGITEEVKDLLLSYKWPGNIRELEHVVEGAIHVMEGEYIEINDLPNNLIKFYQENQGYLIEAAYATLPDAIGNLEIRMINEALNGCDSNITRASKILGIPRQTLQSKMKKYKMVPKNGR